MQKLVLSLKDKEMKHVQYEIRKRELDILFLYS